MSAPVGDIKDSSLTTWALSVRGVRGLRCGLLSSTISFASAALGSRAGGGGTVYIQSTSRPFSCVRSRMSSSEYSNSGDQNSASKGHASMQMPQYMQRAKSMAKRSSTLRVRSRPPLAGAGTTSLCESI